MRVPAAQTEEQSAPTRSAQHFDFIKRKNSDYISVMSLGAFSTCHFAPGRKKEHFNSLWNRMRCRNITNNKNNLITPAPSPPPLRRLYPTTTTLSVSKRTPAGLSGETHMSAGSFDTTTHFQLILLQISPTGRYDKPVCFHLIQEILNNIAWKQQGS